MMAQPTLGLYQVIYNDDLFHLRFSFDNFTASRLFYFIRYRRSRATRFVSSNHRRTSCSYTTGPLSTFDLHFTPRSVLDFAYGITLQISGLELMCSGLTLIL